MRSSILKGFVFLWVGCTVLLLGQLAGAQEWQGNLIGTWRVQVVLVDCQTGIPLGKPFPSLLTFSFGGTMVEDTTNPAFAPGQRSAGQGGWTPERGGYTARSVAFIHFTTPPNPATHNPGFEAGQQTITQEITVKNDHEWASSAAIQFTDTTNTVYRQGCAVASAERF